MYISIFPRLPGRARIDSGHDPTSATEAIKSARARKPSVALDVALNLKAGGLSGMAEIKVTSRSPAAEKTPLLLCAVLTEDRVVPRSPRVRTGASRWWLDSQLVKFNTSSSSSKARHRKRNSFRSRSSRLGSGRISIWPFSSRTNAPHPSISRPTSRGEQPRLRNPLGLSNPHTRRQRVERLSPDFRGDPPSRIKPSRLLTVYLSAGRY